MPRTKKKERRSANVSKRLQTELQSLVAFACYDSKEILQCGKSAKRKTIVDRLLNMYMPSTNPNNDRASHVEQFLDGYGKFKHLFVEKVFNSCSGGETDPGSAPRRVLMLPEYFHCMKGKEILVEDDCISKSLLTRKNLTNIVDIRGDTLYRAAKEVEANCRKALSLCLAENSPYRTFNGTFPSGTNWEDYLLWLRKEMRALTAKAPVTDLEDDKEEDSIIDDNGSNSNVVDPPESDEDYFKGYFAFALWGYIPPEGGEKYKSSLIATVCDTASKPGKKNSRVTVKEEESEEKEYVRRLEARGQSKASSRESERMLELTSLMVNGRRELSKMQLYQCKINNMEFQLKFTTSRIKEIKEEIRELKDEAGSDDDIDDELKELKSELKSCKESRNSLYTSWKALSDEEVARRTQLQTSTDTHLDKISNDTTLSSSSSLKRKHSEMQMSKDKDVPEMINSGENESDESNTSGVTAV